MGSLKEIDMNLFIGRLDDMRLKMTAKEKETLVNNFSNLVKAQFSAEETIASDRLNDIPLLSIKGDTDATTWKEGGAERNARVKQTVEMTGQGLMALYETIVKPENKDVAERILSDRSHLNDLNKILETSAIIAGNPGKVPPEAAVEMERLLKKKSRDFGMARLQIFATANLVAGALSQLGPVLGTAFMGPGAVHAGAVLHGAFASMGAGLKTGAIYLAQNPLADALIAVTGAFATYVGVREYNTKTRRGARAEAREAAAAKKLDSKKESAMLNEIKNATAASDALNKVMSEYHNKIEGKGYINATVNTVLGGSSSLREARRLLGEKTSSLFDAAVPYLPSPYDLYKGDFKELRKTISAVLHAPYHAGAAVVAGGSAMANMALNAIKGTKKSSKAFSPTWSESIIARLAVMKNEFDNTMDYVGSSLDLAGRAAVTEITTRVNAGFVGLKAAMNNADGGRAYLEKLSKDIQYDVKVITTAVIKGSYKLAESASLTVDSMLKSLTKLGKEMAKGFHTLGKQLEGHLKTIEADAISASGKVLKALDKRPVFVSREHAEAVRQHAAELKAASKEQRTSGEESSPKIKP